jgi:branched-subunit amino acid aminotransferase/4-amino-4-deoxychorismate lyase
MELNGVPVTLADLAPLGLVNFGHFTSMRVENRAVRGLPLHLDRLRRDCRAVFDAELDPDRVRDLVRHAVREVSDPVVVRVSVYDPALELAWPGAEADPHVLVSFRRAAASPQRALRLRSAVYARELPKIKHLGLCTALYHRRCAQRAGFDDVLFVGSDGIVSEIATSNIGFVTADGQLVWPRAEMLAGTTMRLINQARDEEVVSERVTLAGLGQYSAVVATNAAVGVRAVSGIDNDHWPEDHPLVAELRKVYESIPPHRI